MIEYAIGDGWAHDPSMYEIPVSIDQAQEIASGLALAMGLQADPRVEAGRVTRRRLGHCKLTQRYAVRSFSCPWISGRLDGRVFLIRLNSRGRNLGTLLHEIAHISKEGELIRGHGVSFKIQLFKVVKKYRELQPLFATAGVDEATSELGGGGVCVCRSGPSVACGR